MHICVRECVYMRSHWAGAWGVYKAYACMHATLLLLRKVAGVGLLSSTDISVVVGHAAAQRHVQRLAVNHHALALC
jgi:hypothetical protein